MRVSVRILTIVSLFFTGASANADLPSGYLIWTKGGLGDMASRRIYRMTLPDKTDMRALTSGEDIEGQISPDGRWVAYAKAKLPGGTDYHNFDRWSVYVVGIEGIGAGAEELLIDADGYWPSWGADGTLYYSQANGRHTYIMQVELDASGGIAQQSVLLDTDNAFPSIPEINEAFVAPDASWFAGRTRGISESGVGAYLINPPTFERMSWAGSSGCMPYVAPSGTWGFNSGSGEGVLWGHAPDVSNRQVDQVLVPPKNGGRCYHPGISTDEQWFMTGHSTTSDQNAGPWDIYIYRLQSQTVSDEQLLLEGDFNGWPHIWVSSSLPDAGASDSSAVDAASASDAAAADTSAADASVADSHTADASSSDTFAGDVGQADTGANDSSVPDGSGRDAGSDDRGARDAAAAEDGRQGEGGVDLGGDAARMVAAVSLGQGCACGSGGDPAHAVLGLALVLGFARLRRKRNHVQHS